MLRSNKTFRTIKMRRNPGDCRPNNIIEGDPMSDIGEFSSNLVNTSRIPTVRLPIIKNEKWDRSRQGIRKMLNCVVPLHFPTGHHDQKSGKHRIYFWLMNAFGNRVGQLDLILMWTINIPSSIWKLYWSNYWKTSVENLKSGKYSCIQENMNLVRECVAENSGSSIRRFSQQVVTWFNEYLSKWHLVSEVCCYISLCKW